MRDDDTQASRSIADEIGESVLSTVETPVEIFFLALFVVGALSLAATTLVGPCGNVDDVRLLPDPREIVYAPGSAVTTTVPVVFGETVIDAGACGIISGVDHEKETAEVHILAKASPFFLGAPETYRPSRALSSLGESPVGTFLFLHTRPPTGEVSLLDIAPVATRGYTNAVRGFYLHTIWFVMGALAVFVAVFGYVGYRFERKRRVWYTHHRLRSLYLSRLLQDKQRMRELQAMWEKATEMIEEDDPGKWRSALSLMDEILDSVLTLLRFSGTNTTEKLRTMTEKDLWTIERLWQAHSVVIRMGERGRDVAPVTEQTVEKAADRYKESLIWLGLLPYWTRPLAVRQRARLFANIRR